jgi:hypothetical protein
VRLEELAKLKKKIHLIGIRTRDLPACSIVPQSTTLPRTPVQKYRTEKYMQINIFKINMILLLAKKYFNYYFSGVLIVRTDCVKDLGVTLDSKLHFHRHADYLTFSGTKAVRTNSLHLI